MNDTSSESTRMDASHANHALPHAAYERRLHELISGAAVSGVPLLADMDPNENDREAALVDWPAAPPALMAPVAPWTPAPVRDVKMSRRWWQRLRLGRLVRRVVALVIVLMVVWWLVLPFIFPISGQAVVNARIVQVRAPNDGTTLELMPDIGDSVAPDQAMMRIANNKVDTSHLAALQTKRSELTYHLKRLHSDLQEIVRAEASLRDSTRRYQQALISSLESSLQEATASVQMAFVAHDASRMRVKSLQRLADRQAGSMSELNDARESESVARNRVQLEQAALAKLKGELQAAKEGLFLQKEAPHFQQRGEELALKIPQDEAEIQEATSMLKAVETELKAEQERVDRLSRATAVSPVSGIVWARQGNLGQVVKQNEIIYEVADSSSIFVEALLHQRYLSSVVPGCHATINLTGGQTLTGRVRAVRTRGPAETEPSFAVNLADKDLKQVRVIIDFDAADHGASLIGRHVRVLFSDENPGPFQQAMAWLFSKLGA